MTARQRAFLLHGGLFLFETTLVVTGIALVFTPHRPIGVSILAVFGAAELIRTVVFLYVRRFANRNAKPS